MLHTRLRLWTQEAAKRFRALLNANVSNLCITSSVAASTVGWQMHSLDDVKEAAAGTGEADISKTA